MQRLIYCTKLKKQAEGLSYTPYPGPLGERIYQSISQEAWQQWLARQTLFINEYHLSSVDPKAREFLQAEMEKFLFSVQDQVPSGYVPPEA